MGEFAGRLRYIGFMVLWVSCALLLILRLAYLYVSDPQRFPVTTIKIAAPYQHITRQQLENVLLNYQNDSFISLSITRLKSDLTALAWADNVQIERVWPDTIKIVLVEKNPVVVWNDEMMTKEGNLFSVEEATNNNTLPHLIGPSQQHLEVLQIYQKLSKLLSNYGLQTATLQLRDNQAWDLGLTNGVQLRLGKRNLEQRVLRFCRAYPAVFADKLEQLSTVDLRYARGMAVQWKEPSK